MNLGLRFGSVALVLCLATSALLPVAALAETHNVGSSDDSYLQSASPNRNNGSRTFMDLNNVRDGVVKFDISAIPAGSTITSATLTLVATSVGSASAIKNYGAHRILAAWDEGAVTWNTPGSIAGTHFASSPTDMVPVSGVGSYSWDVTADVAAFADGSAANEGWRIIWDSNSNGTNRQVDFGTKENTTPSNRPVLSVTYAAPPSSSNSPAPPAKGRTDLFPEEIKASILPEGCTTDPNVHLLLHTHNAVHVMISNLPDFSDATWQPYEVGMDRFEIREWALTPGDGEKTVYIRFKSPTGLESGTVEATVRVDQTTLCQSESEHRHISGPEGDVHAAETDPLCRSDYAHAAVEPYIVTSDGTPRGWRDRYVRVTRISDTETDYAFTHEIDAPYDDAVVRIQRVGRALTATVVGVRNSTVSSVMLRIEAADRGIVANELLWDGDSRQGPQSSRFDLDAYPGLCESDLVPHPHAGDLFQGPSSGIYYFGHDLKRHAFPDEDVFKSWFPTSTHILSVATYQLSAIPLGENVTLRPGTLVRIIGEILLYVIDVGRKLRVIIPQPLADVLYGPLWELAVIPLNPAALGGYLPGYPLASEYDPLVTLIHATSTSLADLWPAPETDPLSHIRSFRLLDERIVMEGLPYSTGDANIRFRILGPDGHALTSDDLPAAKTSGLHLIIVHEDLSEFQHLHPEEANGLWSTPGHFKEEGHYYAFVDVAPEKGRTDVLRGAFPVGDNPRDSADFPVMSPEGAAHDGPFRMELLKKSIPVGRETVLLFRLTKDGKPFSDVQSYMGAYDAHLVILKHQDLNTYIHTHPMDMRMTDGTLEFMTRFPYPGRYTLFVQVMAEDMVHDFPITIDVP